MLVVVSVLISVSLVFESVRVKNPLPLNAGSLSPLFPSCVSPGIHLLTSAKVKDERLDRLESDCLGQDLYTGTWSHS